MLTEGDHEGIERISTYYNLLAGNRAEYSETFSIEIKLHAAVLDRYHRGDFVYEMRIDGATIHRRIASESVRPRMYNASSMPYQEQGRAMTGQLRFAKLRTTSDAASANRQIGSSEDSSISVDIEAGTEGVETASDCMPSYVEYGNTGGVVREQEAKLIGSAVGTINATPAKPFRACEWTPLDDQKPYHRFILKYRTRSILEVLKVIEPELMMDPTPPPAPAPAQGKRKRSDSSQGEGSGDDVQKQMLEAILDMRREMNGMRRTIKDLKQEKAKERPQTFDLTGDDSD